MTLPSAVKIVEVGPRDGLQNEPHSIPTSVKIDFINQLSETGLSVIEATSFVSPKWVPQLADGSEVLAGITRHPQVIYPVLVPNIKGYEQAKLAGATAIAVFTTASEKFSQKNTNCSVAESLVRMREVVTAAKRDKLAFIRGYVSCVLGCPYAGEMDPKKVAEVASELIQIGCDEISLGDTIGVGTPNQVTRLIHTVNQLVPVEKLAVHFHDTYGQALANIYAALQAGVSIIDAAVAGLGGCPYAKGASGNVATEEVIYLLNGLGIRTGVDLAKLVKVGRYLCERIGKQPASKVNQAFKLG